jgi:hypothetical protein
MPLKPAASLAQPWSLEYVRKDRAADDGPDHMPEREMSHWVNEAGTVAPDHGRVPDLGAVNGVQ